MQATSPAIRVLDFEEAREVVLNTMRGVGCHPASESVALDQAHGRTLAEDLSADRDYPALRRSLRDGFAVRAADLPGTLQVRGEVRAGDISQALLQTGEALEIMTGAPLPEGADAVVMVEHIERVEGGIKIDRSAEPGQHINNRGAEAQQGVLLISKGIRLDASHIATLAMTGHASVEAFAKPRVAILATGDEIVPIDQTPEPHQIRNSNSFMLASLVRNAGGAPTILPVSPDRSDALRASLKWGLSFDLLLVSGGVSAGKYDLVKPVLRELGTQFLFERVRVQPGQPTAFGLFEKTPVFGLPGNPGSSLITFELFAKPALEFLSGNPEPLLPLLTATFEAPFRHKLGLTRFLPARLSADGMHLRHISWQGSSDIPALAKANVFLVADHDRETWDVGDSIRILFKP